MIGITSVLQFLGFFMQTAMGKQVTESIKLKTRKTARPWYFSRRFVGIVIGGLALVASNVMAGVNVTDAQTAEIVDYVLQGLDMLTVYGPSLAFFGLINRGQA